MWVLIRIASLKQTQFPIRATSFIYFFLWGNKKKNDICLAKYKTYTKFILSIGTDRPANSVDPDQMPQNVASDQGLYCLPLIKQYLYISVGHKMVLLKY